MSLTIGIAVNDKRYILQFKRIKSAKPSLWQRLKRKMSDLFVIPIPACGLA